MNYGDAAFLLDRLDDFEREIQDDDLAREWSGHVAPAIARFRESLPAVQERRVPVTPGLKQRLQWALTVYRHSRVQHEAKIHNVLLECSDVLLGPQPFLAEKSQS